MSNINVPRLVAGGLIAGLVQNVADFLVNGGLLGAQWEACMRALHFVPTAATMGVFVGVNFVFGLAMVWIYVGFRPRFGLKAAALAAGIVWIVASAAYAGVVAMGVFPLQLALISHSAGLAGMLVSSFAGAATYRE